MLDSILKQGSEIQAGFPQLDVEANQDRFCAALRDVHYLTDCSLWTAGQLRAAALQFVELALHFEEKGIYLTDCGPQSFQQGLNAKLLWFDPETLASQEPHGADFEKLQRYYIRPLYLYAEKPSISRVVRTLLSHDGIGDDEFSSLSNALLLVSGANRTQTLMTLRDWLNRLQLPTAPAGGAIHTQWEAPVDQLLRERQPKRLFDAACSASELYLKTAQSGSLVYAADRDSSCLEQINGEAQYFSRETPGNTCSPVRTVSSRTSSTAS